MTRHHYIRGVNRVRILRNLWLYLRLAALFIKGYSLQLVYNSRMTTWNFGLMLPGQEERTGLGFNEDKLYKELLTIGIFLSPRHLRSFLSLLELTVLNTKKPTQPLERTVEHLKRRYILLGKGYELRVDYGYGYVPEAIYSFPGQKGHTYLHSKSLKDELQYLFYEHTDKNDRRYFVELLGLDAERLEAIDNPQLSGEVVTALENVLCFM